MPINNSTEAIHQALRPAKLRCLMLTLKLCTGPASTWLTLAKDAARAFLCAAPRLVIRTTHHSKAPRACKQDNVENLIWYSDQTCRKHVT
eukprot:3671171-Amphidinium_carterae.1